MEETTDLNIILPVHNPDAHWEDSINCALTLLQGIFRGIDYKIIIVNDGSILDLSDRFHRLQEKYGNVVTISYPQNQGKGHAIKMGLRHSDARFYIYTDCDFPFGEDVLLDTYNILAGQKADLVIGTRTREYFSSLPFVRRCLSLSVRSMNFIMLGFRRIDTQAGLKGLNNRARTVFQQNRIHGFIFEMEFIRNCLRNGLKSYPIPVRPRDNIKFNNFKARTIFRELKCYFKLIFS
jgi:glycosyltransferase involved in cell wall biosynthesis